MRATSSETFSRKSSSSFAWVSPLAKSYYPPRSRSDAIRAIAFASCRVISAACTAFPISGGISRSAVNAAAGAQTQIAFVVAAVLVALALTLLTPLFYHLPNVLLAAIILSAVRGLIDIKQMRYLFRVRTTEGALLLVTLVTTRAWNITFGLIIGVVASILPFIAMNSRPNMAALGCLPGTEMFRNIENFAEAEQVRDLLMLRIDASLYFANTEFLKERFAAIAEKPFPPRAVVRDASAVNDLDSSADTALQEIVADYRDRDIDFFIVGVKAPVRDVMKRSGLYEQIGAHRFFYSMEAAVQRYESTGR